MAHAKLRITDKFGRSRFQWLYHGVAGNVQTVREMVALTRNDLGLDGGEFDEGLFNFAHELLTAANAAGHDWQAEISAIFFYVRDRIVYRRDPTGGSEAIADPRQVIATGFGDCDDLAITLAVLLGMLGYPSRFVIAKFDPQADGFQHIYLQVLTPATEWLTLDPTNPQALPGWEAPRSIERRYFNIFGAKQEDLEGFKSVFKKIGKGIKKIAPYAAMAVNVIPGIGQAASAAIGAGLNVAGSIGGGGGSAKGPSLQKQMDDVWFALKGKFEALLQQVQSGAIDVATAYAQGQQLAQSWLSVADQFASLPATQAGGVTNNVNKWLGELASLSQSQSRSVVETVNGREVDRPSNNSQPPGQQGFQVDSTTLMVGGAALVALLLLTRG
jgi:predicted transglutaminase-like cysteine proteinase